ncbi:MAG: hypothetical protein V3W04_05910 [Gammaproteobacteria bacterium]
MKKLHIITLVFCLMASFPAFSGQVIETGIYETGYTGSGTRGADITVNPAIGEKLIIRLKADWADGTSHFSFIVTSAESGVVCAISNDFPTVGDITDGGNGFTVCQIDNTTDTLYTISGRQHCLPRRDFTCPPIPYVFEAYWTSNGVFSDTLLADQQLAPISMMSNRDFSMQWQLWDANNEAVTVHATGLPPGLTIDATGLISGHLGDDAVGDHLTRLSVTNESGDSVNTTLEWSLSSGRPVLLENGVTNTRLIKAYYIKPGPGKKLTVTTSSSTRFAMSILEADPATIHGRIGKICRSRSLGEAEGFGCFGGKAIIPYTEDVTYLVRLGCDQRDYDCIESTTFREISAEWSPSSIAAAMSADGRYIAFDSASSDLVQGDTNNATDVFVYDRVSAETTRVSVSSDGLQGNNESASPAISANGRYIAFYSSASNLDLAEGSSGPNSVYVHDRITGETTQVRADEMPRALQRKLSISADGNFIAFVASFDPRSSVVDYIDRIYLYDRSTDEVTLLAGWWDNSPSMSADGRYIAYYNAWSVINVYDRVSDSHNDIVSVYGSDVLNPSLSADGRYVTFESNANLVFNDTNNANDIFLSDTVTGTLTRISVPVAGSADEADGDSYSPSISPDGRYVVFMSDASNLLVNDTGHTGDPFVYDRDTNLLSRIDLENGYSGSSFPAMDAFGRQVLAAILRGEKPPSPDPAPEAAVLITSRVNGQSTAKPGSIITAGSELTWVYTVENAGTSVLNDVTVTVRQKSPVLGSWETVCTLGTIEGGKSALCEVAGIATDGGANISLNVVRGTTGSGEVVESTNRAFYQGSSILRISAGINGLERNEGSITSLVMSEDGHYIAFSSGLSDLVVDDTNDADDIFLYDRVSGVLNRISISNDGSRIFRSNVAISADGRYIAYSSNSNLVPDDNDYYRDDIYLYDRQTDTTSLVPFSHETQLAYYDEPSISADGRYIVARERIKKDFNRWLESSGRVLLYDRVAGTTTEVPVFGDAQVIDLGIPSITGDGKFIVFTSRDELFPNSFGNISEGIFFHELANGETQLLPLKHENVFYNDSVVTSADGRYVAFQTYASLMPEDIDRSQDVYVYDRVKREIDLASRIDVGRNDIGYWSVSISPDGRYTLFNAIQQGFTYVYDRLTGQTTHALQGIDDYDQETIWAGAVTNGQYMAFKSKSDNLVPGDTNGKEDLFLYELNKPSSPEEPAMAITVQVNNQVATKPGPVLSVGSNLTWTYIANNGGNTTLHDVTVRARQKFRFFGEWQTVCSLGSLEAGESASCEAMDLVTEGPYIALIVVRGTTNTGEVVESTFKVFYQGIPAAVDSRLTWKRGIALELLEAKGFDQSIHAAYLAEINTSTSVSELHAIILRMRSSNGLH